MNLAHIHLLLNHFPTVGMIVGLGLFIVALMTKSDHLKSASLVIFFGIALLSIPTFASGTAAELALQKTPEVSVAMIQAHETAAFEALGVMELTGALAWLGLWQRRRLSRFPQATMAAVLIAGVVTFGLMGWAASIGGDIRHPEIRTGTAPVETATTNPPLARVIGDAMVNLKWGWPASETVHFIGLSLLFGVVLLVDLRMLGFLKSIPYSALHRLLPWGVLGFGVNVVTGILFFIGAPPDFYVNNPVFIWKLALILVAGANALYFTVFEHAWIVGAGDTPPMAAKVAAASGIVLWVGVIFCGQMLPFFGHSF
ncbi:MAG TPA: hypothetical protein VGQ49_18285 [Bryobacteraceae bacterium]|jgi:uncharacterized membrane protein|nr:hypothetical protein [Bryobacteraceae bacterium]